MAEALSNTLIKTENQILECDYKILEGDARRRLKELPDNSVHLIITSPPYGSIKKYSGSQTEIGWDQSFEDYHNSLYSVFKECVRVLHNGCRLVINVGDEFVRSTNSRPYHILPHGSEIVSKIIHNFGDTINYCGDILWHKVSTSKTSGGGKIMGSVYHPRDGHFFVNYEHILVFKKLGKSPKPQKELKDASRFTLDERRVWFKDHWSIAPKRQDEHMAMFPMEIPERLIRMFSFVGEVVLDPFLGSGTTLAAAAKHNRSGIGIDIGFKGDHSWKSIVSNKIGQYISSNNQITFK